MSKITKIRDQGPIQPSTQSPPTQHPLQRLTSPALHGMSPIIHFLGLSSFAASFQYLTANPTAINSSYGWHFQYLTILGLAMATLTFLFASLADISRSPHLFAIKNILSVCTTPLEVLVSILYWTLRTYDKDLVIPQWAQLPLLPDLSFHAVPSILLTVDYLLLSPPWEVGLSQTLALTGVLAAGYWVWVEECFKHNGYYPYPIFELVGFSGRVGLFVMSAVVMTGSTVGLKWVYGAVNGREGKDGRRMEGDSVDPLEQLNKTVNGALKMKDDMIKDLRGAE